MKKILISKNEWQTRSAVTRDGRLQNVYFQSHSSEQLERSFFRGIVTKVLPGIQTAFVEIGRERSGFLHISEVDRDLAAERMTESLAGDDDELTDEEREKLTKKVRRRSPEIGKILQEGQPLLVQVSKEPIYEKGAKLTTCFTIPGRFIVLMPNIPRVGISKKIGNRDERIRLKELIVSLLPKGMGAIVRTTSENKDEKEISKDISYLVATWEAIQAAYEKAEPGQKIHEDVDLTLQIVRDHVDDNVDEVITNDKAVQSLVYKFLKDTAPLHAHKVKLYQEPPDLFEKYQLNKQIDEALQRKVHLKSGGSLIIESTEAMTVVDVNTGRFTGKTSGEDTILQTNLEAAEEITRQLRLRNIGGLIVIDFIDMATSTNRQKLTQGMEKFLREHDRFQSVVLKVSEFGLVQMTRKRSGKTLAQQLTTTCLTCKGLGAVISTPVLAYQALGSFKMALFEMKGVKKINFDVHPSVFEHITTVEYDAIIALEKQFGCEIIVTSDASVDPGKGRVRT